MDFIGNPWNGVLGYLDSLQNDELSSEKKGKILVGLKRCWSDFFERLETFKKNRFKPTKRITIENIDKILTYKDKDFFQPGVINELDNLYYYIVDNLSK